MKRYLRRTFLCGALGVMLLAGTSHADQTAKNVKLNKPQNRPKRMLPSGSKGPGRFGAYYTNLKYSPDWDRAWRTSQHADVVVRFDNFGYRLVFWRGTSYVPCWVTENNIWYNNEFCETIDSHTHGACEPISDKQCRYSHVRIIESNDARAVVHWRYALTDVQYRLAHKDPATGWHDWADEYYTVYPDGVAVRKIVLWSSRLDMWHEFQEAIVLNHPGVKPDDTINAGAVSLANLKGESKTYFWTEAGAPGCADKPKDSCIETINLKSSHRPFLIVPPKGASILVFGGSAPGSLFNCWDHWPVSQDASIARVVKDFDRPSHSSLSWVVTPREPAKDGWEAFEITDQSITKLLLNGMTDKPAAELAPLGRSWLQAPKLQLTGDAFLSQGYDQSQRAYVLTCKTASKPSELVFTLAANNDSPVVDLALVIENWGDVQATLKLNGEAVQRGKNFRYGYRHRLEGTDLIVWIATKSVKPIRVSLEPTAPRP